MYSLFQWLDTLPVSRFIRGSTFMFPAIEVVHLFGLVMLLGTLVIVNARLLGYGMRRQKVSQVWNGVWPWMHTGLVTMVITGIALFISEALKCYSNPAFWYKMGFLVAALLFHFSAYRKVASSDSIRLGLTRLAGIASLLLWFGVGLAGRAIAFV